MRIKYSALLIIIVFLFQALVFGGIVLIAQNDLDENKNNNIEIKELMISLFNQYVISNTLIENKQNSTFLQWEILHVDIDNQINNIVPISVDQDFLLIKLNADSKIIEGYIDNLILYFSENPSLLYDNQYDNIFKRYSLMISIKTYSMMNYAQILEQDSLSRLNISRSSFTFSFLLFIFSSSILIFLIVYYIFINLLRPIVKLNQSMKSVSDGNLEIEVPSNEKNEIGELGFEFNRMTKNLHKTYISLKQEIKNKEENEEKLKLLNLELDSKVSERTEKLQKSNAELEHFTSTKEILEKEVKKRTKELEIEKRKIETIIETIPDPIILFNDDYEISFANKSFFLLKNKIDQIFKDKKSINNNKSIVPLITDILKDKDNIEMTIEPVENNYYMAKSKNVIDPENDLRIGTVVELSDITNFVKYDKLQKEFFSSISHELRTPITALKLSLENLAKYGNKLDIQKQERIWNILTSNTNLLADMIEDLLLLSRVQEHRLELKLEDCEINSIIMETVIPQLELSRSNKNIEITTNIQKNLRIIADHKRLSQIFRIFIDNGIKYSENDKKIVISSLINYQGLYNPQNKKGCLIKIIDEGIGIRKEELGNLFKRFYRSNDVNDKVRGSGLGLVIAKELIELHNGNVYIESKYKEGTTVNIFFPF